VVKGTYRPSASGSGWGGGGRWQALITDSGGLITVLMVRVKCSVGGGEKVNTGGIGEGSVLFLAVSFISVCVERVSRLCLRSCRPLCRCYVGVSQVQ
jgi:hypothetical protein